MPYCLQMFIFDVEKPYQAKLRYFFLLLLIIISTVASAQKITGVVLDKATQRAIAGATVTYKGHSTQSTVTGLFEIVADGPRDTLRVTMIGYKPFAVLITKTNLNPRAELETSVTTLRDVDITSTHSFKQDSLANRADYAKQFNYTPSKLRDVVGFNPGNGSYQLLSINVLTLINYLTYKSTNDYKFKKVLIRDEREQYVDEKFNRGLVSRITDLRGDTLSTFLARYRPTYQFALKSTEYDMEVFVRDCYKKFAADGFKVDSTFAVNN